MYDIIVIGSGPAGLCAALYALRAGKSVLVLEKENFGGQVTFSPKLENYPGSIQISGSELADKMVEQVLAQGAEVELDAALRIEDGEIKKVVCESGSYESRAVIIASGAKHRLLGAAGEENYIGDGISFCAVCDGAFYKGKNVAIVGGGNSALQEAVLLSDICSHLTVIQNLAFLTGEKKLAEQLAAKENVEIIYETVVDEILGDGKTFCGVKIRNTASGEVRKMEFDGLFVAIGLVPQNEEFANVLKLDSRGYADVGEDCRTGTAGIFVAGDCRAKRIRQVTTAIADGAVAALAACEYIDSLS